MRSLQRQTGAVALTRGLFVTSAASLSMLLIVLGAVAWLALQGMPAMVPPGAEAKSTVVVKGGSIVVTSIDGPVTVRVRTLEVDRSEVDVARYRACVAAGRCDAPAALPAWGPAAGKGGECNHEHPARLGWPMSCVTVKDAIDYCQWQDARLPTASEWRYLATSAAAAEAGLRDVADGLEEWACDVAPEAEEVDDVVCWTFAKMSGSSLTDGAAESGEERKPRYYWRDGHRSATTGFRCVR